MGRYFVGLKAFGSSRQPLGDLDLYFLPSLGATTTLYIPMWESIAELFVRLVCLFRGQDYGVTIARLNIQVSAK